MKNIKRFAILSLALLCLPLLTSCGTTGIQNMIVRKGTSEAVKYSIKNWPETRPYIAATGPVVCSVAAGTNLSPDAVISALESSAAANALKTSNGVVAANMIINVYSAAWEIFGADEVKNRKSLQDALLSACHGIEDGLAGRSRSMRRYLQ